MFRKLFCLGLLIPWTVWSSSLKIDSRFEHQITQNDLAVFSGHYHSSPLWNIDLETSGRISMSLKDLENWSYSLSGTLPVVAFLSTTFRVSQENWLSASTSTSSLLLAITLKAAPLGFLELFLQGGWYRRFVTLNKSQFLPLLLGSNYSEHDFAVALGTQIHLSPTLSALAKVSTFEEISVYNLNHPFIQTDFTYEPAPSVYWTLYSRYQLLLGFGRMDSIKIGLNLSLPLS